MSAKSREIGDPLAQVAATGKIGGRTSSAVQHAGSPETQIPRLPDSQDAGSLETQTAKSSKGQKGGRVQQTIYLPPDLAKRIKHQAIEEGREISEIAADALEMYLR